MKHEHFFSQTIYFANLKAQVRFVIKKCTKQHKKALRKLKQNKRYNVYPKKCIWQKMFAWSCSEFRTKWRVKQTTRTHSTSQN